MAVRGGLEAYTISTIDLPNFRAPSTNVIDPKFPGVPMGVGSWRLWSRASRRPDAGACRGISRRLVACATTRQQRTKDQETKDQIPGHVACSVAPDVSHEGSHSHR